MVLARYFLLHTQLMRNSILLVIFLVSYSLQAQKVTGYWYGQANVEMNGSIHNNYLTELIVAQKGNKIKGFFGYYFKDVYQSFLIKGTFDPQTRQVVFRNIPIIYFNTNSTINSVDCITSFYGTLLVSRVKTTLTGYFLRDKKYEYTCPDLRATYTLYSPDVNEDSLFNDVASIKRYWKPLPQNYGIAEEEKKKDDEPMAVVKPGKMDSIVRVGSSTALVAAPTTIGQNAPLLIRKDILKITEAYKKRKAVLDKELEITSDSIRLSFYDNAEVDGDSISVFLNNNLLLAHQELNAQAFNVYIKLDSTKEINEVSMFAENLGKYPPNTALMVVNDGYKRYEVFLSSDFKGNATVRFKRKKTEPDQQ
jgi:hypothetical protein